VPHDGQRIGNAKPHWLQNFAPSDTPTPQLEHFIRQYELA
jgi:hypothetical protein